MVTKQAKYIPEPWAVRRGRTRLQIQAANGHEVAHLGGKGAGPLEIYQDAARLIAAAPELLEALEALMSEAPKESGWVKLLGNKVDPLTFSYAWGLVKAAIAKARGQ